jgi:hypothetical protein
MERDMSFVLIENYTDGISKVNLWIKDTRNKSKDGKITPEFAMEVLSKTNHSEHLKTILRNIGEKCGSIKERLEYKDFVLSAVEGRTHIKDVGDYLRSLADEGGYLEEFNEAENLPKHYGAHDCMINCYFIKMKDEKQNVLNVDSEIMRAGVGCMTPDIAKGFLKETNHFANIKKVVDFIEQRCRKYNIDEIEYKEVILACVSRREVSPQSYEKLEAFAKRNGFLEEFEKIHAIPKFYDKLGNVIPKENDKDNLIKSLKSMSADQLKI